MSLRYFTRDEFACKHCGENRMDDAFLQEVDDLRHACAFPFVISSGYRCPDHNEKVSGTGRTGPHTTGRSADIATSHANAHKLLKHALAKGFTGIGVQQKGGSRFIHIDNLPNAPGQPRPTVWSY